MMMMMPKTLVPGPYYRIDYEFHLVHFSTTDWDNLIKVNQDFLAKLGIITDDRFIIDARVRKFKAEKDRIEIEIISVKEPL